MDQDRKSALVWEFRKLNIDFDQSISEEAIFKFLDEKSGGTFDNSIALQLHQQVLSQYQKLTVNNFISVYAHAELLLRDKINKARNEIHNLTITKTQSTKTLQDLRKQEQFNQYGIMESSMLQINSISAVINKLSLSQKVFIVISSNCNSFQTSAQNDLNWKDPYEFPIETGKEEVSIVVRAYQGNSTLDIGNATLHISQFNSQAQTDVELKLTCFKPYSGVIVISGLWIYSKTKYFQDIIHQIDQQINQLQDDISDFQNDLDTLLKVFPQTMISHSEINNIIQASPEKTISPIDNIELQTLSKSVVAIMALMITISSLDRCCFLDVFIYFNKILIILVYSIKYKDQQLDRDLLKKISIATFFSFLIDIFWIVQLMGPLLYKIDTPDMGIQKTIAVTGLLLFIIKLPFSFLCAYLSNQQPLIPVFQDVNENDFSGLQPLEYQNISRNESLSSYQQFK